MWGNLFIRDSILEAIQADATEENEREAARLIHYAVTDQAFTMILSILNTQKSYNMGTKTVKGMITGASSNVGIYDQDAINEAFG